MPSNAELIRRVDKNGPIVMDPDAAGLVARFVAGQPDAETLTEMILGGAA